MSGPILAGYILAAVTILAQGVALFASQRTKKPQEAVKPQKGRSAEFITAEELDARLKEFAKAQEWQMDEWYEKFSTLHARLAKRQQRAKKEQEEIFEDDEQAPPPSVIHLRRIGSV